MPPNGYKQPTPEEFASDVARFKAATNPRKRYELQVQLARKYPQHFKDIQLFWPILPAEYGWKQVITASLLYGAGLCSVDQAATLLLGRWKAWILVLYF